jgi:hypothetical protein
MALGNAGVPAPAECLLMAIATLPQEFMSAMPPKADKPEPRE